jgi:hypothetical protein
MKKIVILLSGICFLLSCPTAFATKPDTLAGSKWQHNLEADFYIWKDDFLFMSVYSVDKDWLHLEARYNYEDINTFSAWFGYNFNGGNKFQYTITPMLGGILGNTNGIAPGLELDFQYYGFELSTQSEYVFDFQGMDNNYFYNWTDFTYSPLDWLWFGLSFQRTRLYETPLEFQYGLLAGGGYKWFGLTGYLYNLGSDDPYLILSLTINVPEN